MDNTEKFQVFKELLKAEVEMVVIHHPQVLGDNYEEIVENLNLLADSGKSLMIIPQSDRPPLGTRRDGQVYVKAAEDIKVGPVTQYHPGCTPEDPCCDKRGEYNGLGSGPLIFVCPKHCSCHD